MILKPISVIDNTRTGRASGSSARNALIQLFIWDFQKKEGVKVLAAALSFTWAIVSLIDTQSLRRDDHIL